MLGQELPQKCDPCSTIAAGCTWRSGRHSVWQGLGPSATPAAPQASHIGCRRKCVSVKSPCVAMPRPGHGFEAQGARARLHEVAQCSRGLNVDRLAGSLACCPCCFTTTGVKTHCALRWMTSAWCVDRTSYLHRASDLACAHTHDFLLTAAHACSFSSISRA